MQNRLLYLSLYPYSVHLLIIVSVDLKHDIPGVLWKIFLLLFNFQCINFMCNTHRLINSMHYTAQHFLGEWTHQLPQFSRLYSDQIIISETQIVNCLTRILEMHFKQVPESGFALWSAYTRHFIFNLLCKVVPLLCNIEPLSQCPVLFWVIAVQSESVKYLDTYLVTGALPLSAW